MALAKIIDLQTGQDITPAPLSPEDELKERFANDLVRLINGNTLDVIIDYLFTNYSIKNNDQINQ